MIFNTLKYSTFTIEDILKIFIFIYNIKHL